MMLTRRLMAMLAGAFAADATMHLARGEWTHVGLSVAVGALMWTMSGWPVPDPLPPVPPPAPGEHQGSRRV